jgi:mannose/fructose/N-acetylgalactosamine-specific phosphotransferase system component IIC
MINWFNLLTNTLWIFGCAIVLATISYTSWEASTQKSSFKDLIRQHKIQLTLNVGGIFFSIGLTGTTQIMWQKILWALLSLGFLIQIIIETVNKNKNQPPF